MNRSVLRLAIGKLCLHVFGRYFKQPVSWNYSTVKISDEVPRDDGATIETVYWTAQLEEVFKLSAKEDPFLR